MTLNFYLVRDNPNDDARLFRRVGQPSNQRDIWIPRSVCKSVTKFPPTANKGGLRLTAVEVEDWWAQKNGLG